VTVTELSRKGREGSTCSKDGNLISLLSLQEFSQNQFMPFMAINAEEDCSDPHYMTFELLHEYA
jgi:hypothetical protein